MTKTILYITGTVVLLATSTLLFLNKIDLQTTILFNSTVLTALYGWYTKTMLNQQEILTDTWRNEVIKLDIQNSRKDEFIQSILRNNENLKKALYEQKESEKEESEKPDVETPVEKTKRVRKPKK